MDYLSSELESSTRDGQRKLRNACLARDGNRCVISGYYDTKLFEKLSALDRQNLNRATTEAAHIIPFSFGHFREPEVAEILCMKKASMLTMNQRINTARAWDALYRYFPDIRSRLNFSTSNINDECNAMTLTDFLHREFGRFNFVLKKTVRILDARF